jgi:hypothetical protein
MSWLILTTNGRGRGGIWRGIVKKQIEMMNDITIDEDSNNIVRNNIEEDNA